MDIRHGLKPSARTILTCPQPPSGKRTVAHRTVAVVVVVVVVVVSGMATPTVPDTNNFVETRRGLTLERRRRLLELHPASASSSNRESATAQAATIVGWSVPRLVVPVECESSTHRNPGPHIGTSSSRRCPALNSSTAGNSSRSTGRCLSPVQLARCLCSSFRASKFGDSSDPCGNSTTN